jgi:hypothetical protein
MLRVAGVVAVGVLFSAGCGERLLTPDVVREHLAAPKGTVGADTVGRSTRDFFAGQRTDGALNMGLLSKGLGGENATSSAWAGGNRAFNQLASMDDGDISAADVACAAGLALAISSYDECEYGNNCEAKLELDSCVLRIGEGADDYATGKITFLLKNTATDTVVRQELRLEFSDFESSDSETTTQYLDGIVAVETTEENVDGVSTQSVIVTGDVVDQTRLIERGFLSDGVQESTRASGAVRFGASQAETEESVSVEVLGFVDDSDDTRDESVVLTFNARERDIADKTLTEAALTVTGSNGSFQCTWSSAEEELADGEERVSGAGSCVDENGETFNFSAESSAR